MKFEIDQRLKGDPRRFIVLFACSMVLAGCDSESSQRLKQMKDVESQHEGVSVSGANNLHGEKSESKKLLEAASKANLPMSVPNHVAPVPDYAIDFVGRYYANVDCKDGFAPCKEGTAEFILTLIADGTVYRSILQHGKVFTFKNEKQTNANTYQKDRWAINPERTELIVYRKEGVNIYYDIQDSAHLVMNVEKTRRLNERPGEFKMPTVAYTLKKDIELASP